MYPLVIDRYEKNTDVTQDKWTVVKEGTWSSTLFDNVLVGRLVEQKFWWFGLFVGWLVVLRSRYLSSRRYR